MSELHVLRVFTTSSGEHGNELGVFLDGTEVPEAARQGVARDLGYSETVFVGDAERGELRIFTPELELPFAGHPSVGTAWLLREVGREVACLHASAGELPVRYEGDVVSVLARAEWAPPFSYVEFASTDEVDQLTGAPGDEGWSYCWAWENQEAGTIRARSFVAEAGIGEDEATGSAALALCAQVGRPIRVRQGRGSEIVARPVNDGFTEVGGRCIGVDVRSYEILR